MLCVNELKEILEDLINEGKGDYEILVKDRLYGLNDMVVEIRGYEVHDEDVDEPFVLLLDNYDEEGE